MTAGEDYTLKLWVSVDGMIDENSQRYLEEDLSYYPLHISLLIKCPNQFLILYANDQVKLYDSSEHHPCIKSFDVPMNSKFSFYNEYNDQFVLLHENNISLYSVDGNFINKFTFQTLFPFTNFVKIFYLAFIGKYLFYYFWKHNQIYLLFLHNICNFDCILQKYGKI